LADRVPAFELHILPMIRMLDRDHMLARIDLWNRDAVWQAREAILDHLKGELALMPTQRSGGPWPSEWITLFERWIATAQPGEVGHHLDLFAPDSGVYELVPAFGGKLDLIAKVTLPSPGYRLWFELRSVAEAEREYLLYGEAPVPAEAPAPTAAQAAERLKKAGLDRIFVIDSRGRQQIEVH
jgi:hypothetical protein